MVANWYTHNSVQDKLTFVFRRQLNALFNYVASKFVERELDNVI